MNREEIEDILVLCEASKETVVKYKKELENFCEEIADIMPKLKTDKGKQELANLTQGNFAKMIELEVNIGELDSQINFLKRSLVNGIFM